MNSLFSLGGYLQRWPRLVFWLRIFWVAVELIVVFWFAKRGSLFYYQGF